MIHQEKYEAVAFIFDDQMADGRLNGRKLALFPILIDDDHGRVQRHLRADGIGVRSKDNNGRINFRMASNVQQMLEKCAALVLNQSFWGAHAAGFAAREDYGRQHEVQRA